VIINGRSRRCVWWWSKHLQDENENERVRVVKVEGLASENIYDLLCEIEGQGLGTRCKNPLWIAAINPGPKEQFSEQDRDRAREILEQERGYQGQPYFMVEHEKRGWKHWHVIYSRIDVEHMRALPDALDAKVCHAAARRIESELGLTRVIGPFDREPGTPRPPRAPEPWEMYRGMQTKIDPREIEAEVTALFRQSETGKAFQAALESHGYQLVTGQRGLLILDSAGKEHSLARRIDGANTRELNAFMRDVDRQSLPTIEQARDQYQDRKIAGLEADQTTVKQEIEWEEKLARAAIEKEKVAREFVEPKERVTQQEMRRAGAGSREKEWPFAPPPPEAIRTSPEHHFDDAAREVASNRSYAQPEELKGMARQIMGFLATLWNEPELLETKARTLSAFLDEKGISLAQVTKEEADRSHREAEFAKAVGRHAQRFKEGEIVAITEPRPEYRRSGEIIVPGRIHKLDQLAAKEFVASLDKGTPLQGIDATREASDQRAQQRSADWQAMRLEWATKYRDGRRKVGNENAKSPAPALGKSTVRTIGKLFDIAAGAFESLLAPTLTPEQIHDGQKAVHRREAEAEHTIDFSSYTAELAQRQQQDQAREAALQRERDGGGREL
jgi:hypothetical protein